MCQGKTHWFCPSEVLQNCFVCLVGLDLKMTTYHYEYKNKGTLLLITSHLVIQEHHKEFVFGLSREIGKGSLFMLVCCYCKVSWQFLFVGWLVRFC